METNKVIELGNFIRENRESLGFSLTEFADLCNMNKGDLSKLERGIKAKKIEPKLLKEVAKGLGISYLKLYEIIGYIDSPVKMKMESNELKQLGEKIKEYRQRNNLNMDLLAGRIGVSESYICKIERNKIDIPPTEDMLIKIANALYLSQEQSDELLYLADLARTPRRIRELLNRNDYQKNKTQHNQNLSCNVKIEFTEEAVNMIVEEIIKKLPKNPDIAYMTFENDEEKE